MLGGILVIVADVWNKSTKKVSVLYASLFNIYLTRPKLSHLSMKNRKKRKKKLQNQKSQMATAINL